MSDEQAQQADNPSGDGWRWVRQGEALRHGDVQKIDGKWHPTIEAGYTCPRNHCYRRRIEPQQPQATEPDDPSGDDWRWVEVGEWVEPTDMWQYLPGKWRGNASLGALCVTANYYRRRIEQPQPSDSEPETMEQLRKRLDAAVRQNVELADELEDVRRSKTAHQRIAKASVERAQEAEALLAEVERGGEQVNAELQQLREQVATLTRKLKDANDTYQICLQSHWKAGRRSAIDKLQAWLRPVIELVAEDPEDASPLAVAVLGFLPGIASRLIEE